MTKRIENKKIENCDFELDDIECINVTFNNCTMIYRGSDHVVMCRSIFNDCRLIFLDEAAMTLSFVRAMKEGIGLSYESLIEGAYLN